MDSMDEINCNQVKRCETLMGKISINNNNLCENSKIKVIHMRDKTIYSQNRRLKIGSTFNKEEGIS